MDWATILNKIGNLFSSVSTGITWPILWLMVFWVLRKEIKSLLDSVAHLVKKAKNIKSPYMDIQIGGNISESSEYAKMQQAYQSPIITEEKETIRAQILKAQLTSEESIDILIHHLANSHLMVRLTSIYGALSSRHTELLLYLNRPEAFSEAELLDFYEQQKDNTGHDIDFITCMKELQENELIVQRDSAWSINLLGKEYLVFLVRINKLPQLF